LKESDIVRESADKETARQVEDHWNQVLKDYGNRVADLTERNAKLCARNKCLLDEGQTLMNALSMFADPRNWIHQPGHDDDDDACFGFWEFVLSPRDITPWEFCQSVIDSLKTPKAEESVEEGSESE
jgi:hypothetical protein